MRVAEAVKSVLEGAGYTGVQLSRISLIESREGIVVRQGSPMSGRYADGSTAYDIVVEVIVRRMGEADAMDTAWAIRDLLQDQPVSVDGCQWSGTQVYTEPQELELGPDFHYTWNVQFDILLERGY